MHTTFGASQHQAHIQPINSPLHVITVCSNPMRYASRYRLHAAFTKHAEDAGAVVWTVELATGARHFEITDPSNPRHIQVRSDSTLWHKENLVNVGLRHLPSAARYVAWVDADVTFLNPRWVTETVHQLQVYPMVQMFSHAQELDANGVPYIHKTGIGYDWREGRDTLSGGGLRKREFMSYGAVTHHPHGGTIKHEPFAAGADGHQRFFTGYAWAARREVLDSIGGLGDIAILGAGDHHMAWSFCGEVERSLPAGLPASYAEYWYQWQARAARVVRGQLGYVQGMVTHHFHGSKAKRFYLPRWEILRRHKYDWRTDVHHDIQGVLSWSGNKPELETDVVAYFAVRDEDATGL